jgi:hypothetical protein
MPATELPDTNQRIERLEQRLRRRDRALIVCIIFCVATSLLIAQAPSKRMLEAEQFILRGPRGQEFASLEVQEQVQR